MGNPVRSLPITPGPIPVPERELPPATDQRGFQRKTAERLGRFLGIAVVRARDLPRRSADLRQRFIIARGRTGEDASAAAAEWQQVARHKLFHARNQAERIAHEYPVETIAGAAATFFVLGFMLRIWRSRNGRHQ